MAESSTKRLDLPRWSADTDTPNRGEFDRAFQRLEERAAGFLVWDSTGEPDAIARPPATAAHDRFYAYDRATGILTVCIDTTGVGGWAWVEVLTRDAGNAAYEALISRTGASAGEVPTLQGDGTLAFVAGGGDVEVIAETVLAADAASISFASIPATYSHLLLLVSARSTAGAGSEENLSLRFNGDTAGNYEWQRLRAFGGVVDATNATAATSMVFGFPPTAPASVGIPALSHMLIPNYARTTNKKVTRTTGTSQGHRLTDHAGFWASTAAINSISIFVASGNLAAGSVAALYGLSG